jgi:hypothetical protein
MDYAAAVIPHNQDADFQKAIARGAKLGHTIGEKPSNDFAFQKCLCKKLEKRKQSTKKAAQ